MNAREVAELLLSRVKLNYDAQVVLSGGTGDGKSTLAVELSMLIDPAFNMEKQLCYTRKQAIEAIGTLDKFKPIILDESVNMLFRRDFMRKEQKELLRLLDMCRKRNLICFWCMPNFWALDSHFLNSRVHMWVYVYVRGSCHVYLPLKGEHFAYVIDPWCRAINNNQFLGYKYERSPNYKGTFEFPPLSKELEDEYLRVHAVKSVGSETDDEEDEDRKKVGRPRTKTPMPIVPKEPKQPTPEPVPVKDPRDDDPDYISKMWNPHWEKEGIKGLLPGDPHPLRDPYYRRVTHRWPLRPGEEKLDPSELF